MQNTDAPRQMLCSGLTHIVSGQLSCDHLSLTIARIQSPTPGNGLLSTLCRVGDAGGRCLLACFLNPSRAPSTPALYIALVLFLKPLEGERGYTSQLRQHFSLFYKRPSPVLKKSPVKAQATECSHGVGQVSPGACQAAGSPEPAQLSYLGCCDHPTVSHRCWYCVCLEHRWGHSCGSACGPTAPSAPRDDASSRHCPCPPFLGWCLLLLCSPAGECPAASCLPFHPVDLQRVPLFAADALDQDSVSQRASQRAHPVASHGTLNPH